MSEYQYYEFQAIDKPLSKKEQSQISSLSSRAFLTPTQAIFTYNYGDFRGDPEKVLEKYFDAMFYITNWGTKQLMFRLPRTIVNVEQLSAYSCRDTISINKKKDYIILDIQFDEEEGLGWVEGEGLLSSIITLRQDLLNGDFRFLYLAWLKAAQLWQEIEDDEDLLEPPVPVNLDKLNSSLKSFVDLFEIDENLIAVAAEASKKSDDPGEPDLEKLIDKLTQLEQKDFLLRVAKNEPNVGILLKRRLQEFTSKDRKIDKQADAQRRKASDLIKAAEERYNRQKEIKRKKAEEARKRKLNKLAKEEPEVWERVNTLIGQKQTKAYDEAVSLLKGLRDLAEHLGKMEQFKTQIGNIRRNHSSLSGLISRLNGAGLKK